MTPHGNQVGRLNWDIIKEINMSELSHWERERADSKTTRIVPSQHDSPRNQRAAEN